jgi:hypothetical protein
MTRKMTRKNTIGFSQDSKDDEKYHNELLSKYKKQQGEKPGFRFNLFGFTYYNTCKLNPNNKKNRTKKTPPRLDELYTKGGKKLRSKSKSKTMKKKSSCGLW